MLEYVLNSVLCLSREFTVEYMVVFILFIYRKCYTVEPHVSDHP